ncbi:MAG: hypothetical protein AAFQ91_28220 [Cyanobacteria bacterium J06621_15]
MNFQKLIATPIALGLTVGSFPVVNSVAHAKSIEVPIPKSVVSTAFNTALSSTKVRLDNYGRKRGTTWHQNSSFMLFPNGAKQAFPIDEYSYKITKYRRLKYYLNDMNTSSIQTHINGSRLKTTLNFESQGEEVKGKCVRRRFRKWKECSLKMERDIHLNNSRISMSFVPVAYDGSISYRNPIVDFKTDVRVPNRLCRTFKGICRKIEGRINNQLTKTVEQRFTNSLNNPKLKAKVAKSIKNSIRGRLGKYKNWKIVSIQSKGRNYVVRLSN